MMKVRKH